jgi:lactoylglutathione lyase
LSIDNSHPIAEIQRIVDVGIKLALPDDVFDDQFPKSDFVSRIRELAILELVRAKRLHEHEAQQMLGLERWELVQRMEAVGIAPTEKVFEEIRGELGEAIASRRTGAEAPQVRSRNMRLLHTMIRVNNLDETLKFYCDALGMKLLRRKDFPAGEFTLAFVGYGSENETTVIELTHNWKTSSYDQGNAFGHLAVGVEDIYKTCAVLKEKGVKVVREPGPMKYGGAVIAFIEDPNGYKIELIEQKKTAG